MQDAIRELMGDSTVFLVAQRISAVLTADVIVVLEEGRIVAKGSHRELLEIQPRVPVDLRVAAGAGARLMADATLSPVPSSRTEQPLRRLLHYLLAGARPDRAHVPCSASSARCSRSSRRCRSAGSSTARSADGDKTQLAIDLLVLLAFAAGGFLGMWFGGRVLAVAAQDAMYRLRKDVFEHTQTLSLRFFDRQPIGDLMSRITNDLDSVGQLFDKGLYPAINSAFTLVITTVLMFIVSWQLSIAVVLIAPLVLGADADHVALSRARRSPCCRSAPGRSTARPRSSSPATAPSRRTVVEDAGRRRKLGAAQRTRPGRPASAPTSSRSRPCRSRRCCPTSTSPSWRSPAGGCRSGERSSVGTVALVLHLRPDVRSAAQPVRADPEHGAAGRRGRHARLRDPRRAAGDRRPAGRPRRRHGSTGTSSWTTSTSPTCRACRSSTTSRWSRSRARRSGSSARPAPARARSSTSSPATTTSRPGDIRLDDASIYDVTTNEPARGGRHGAAGAVPLLRHGHGEHPLRAARGHRRGVHRGGEGGQRPRLHHAPPRRLRHGALGRRLEPQPGPAAADHDRPHHPRRPPGADPRRGDLERRHPHREDSSRRR